MKRQDLFLFLILSGIFIFLITWAVSNIPPSQKENRIQFDRRIDNIGYWVRKANEGHIPFNPEVNIKPAIFTGSNIQSFSVVTIDSPDVPVTDINATQSENSVFVNPLNSDNLLNSNNSTENPIPIFGGTFGADAVFSFDAAESWEGDVSGAGEDNSGDPTTAVGLNGRWYINYISGSLGQGISFSDDQGETWTTKTIGSNPGEIADKNHMWIDNSPTSPFEGNLYVAWTDFGGPDDENIVLSRSVDHGENWLDVGNISAATNAFNHGVNLSTGINGEVYAVWAVYDENGDESAIGFSKSYDGGITWTQATRVIDSIRGIKLSGTSKNIRVNSFPVATVDLSSGPNSGTIYIVWTNIGEPGINSGNEIDIYLIRSTDEGENWSDPTRVNQEEPGQGKEHFFPWITCDPSNGFLSVIFYDDRNVFGSQCEVFCANSDDGGESWEDFKVSDVSFFPEPIPGLAVDYFGDYLGITALNGWVYPVWTDNRLGYAMSWCSPYQTNDLSRPKKLAAEVIITTGQVNLEWHYEETAGFQHFNIYRNDLRIATTTDTSFIDVLPAFGGYKYRVTAFYNGNLESGGTSARVHWGSAGISINTNHVFEHLTPDSSSVKTIEITNTGQLDLYYNISKGYGGTRNSREYCEASSTRSDGEYIERVQFGDIDKISGSNMYADYTELITSVETGMIYEIEVSNGYPFDDDQCGAWIDWDQNGIFDDGLINFESSPGTGPYKATFTPPFGAKTGITRLRIRLAYTGDLKPCGNTSWGEVEDYSVSVKNWYNADPLADTIHPGETGEVAITFDATGYEPGLLTAPLFFNSNDPDASPSIVDLTLQISKNLVGVSTKSQRTTFCIGESDQLVATPYGVCDTLSFRWFSKPEGFESTQQNPDFTITDSTWFYVEMTSSSNISIDSIYLKTLPQPQISLGPDTSFCGDGSIVLDAGEGYIRYEWSTGDSSQTIVVDTSTLFNGYGKREISVKVFNKSKCGGKDTIRIEFVSCTGLEDFSEPFKTRVYPNPNKGIFNVGLDATFSGQIEILVYNQSGQLVYSKKTLLAEKNKILVINLENPSKGIYQLFIKNKNYVVNKQLIVK